ncbi:hypothetical protein KFK09_006415 [Dendrobium nobile]|uniref:Uncharacterized protein n=1 Tax=Dendrobium nobile TaxID=94219 RepID=A0A8T3BS62_DENNO|nr:hypothetical protein KFK09_006415 [Dendrobium nobile]
MKMNSIVETFQPPTIHFPSFVSGSLLQQTYESRHHFGFKFSEQVNLDFI